MATLYLAACTTVGPDYEVPDAPVPDEWEQAISSEMNTGQPDILTWWETLEDSQLSQYMARARDNSPQLAEAAARVREARALRAIAAGQRVPEIDANGNAGRDRTSDAYVLPFESPTNDNYQFGASASWEVDVWGRVRRLVEAADANLAASVESYRDVLVLLYAQVAFTYTEVRTTQQRIIYTRANIASQQASLQLVNDRNNAGLASDLEVSQARFNLYRTRAFLPSLEAQLASSMNQLSVLLGEAPGVLYDELSAVKPIPAGDVTLRAGLPADLLRRRPDVRAAERALASQTARIGVATAELYPQFGIGGSFGFATQNFSDLTEWGNRSWSYGGLFSWNLFDGGRIRGRIEVQDARTEQALKRYEQTVLDALEDTESSMSDYLRERQRLAMLQESAAAAQESVKLVLVLYRTGLTDFQNVLDMQRSLFEEQDQLATSEGNVTANLVQVYTALGGGWDASTVPDLP